jgi:large conductance mechanosensitive channel
MANMLKEFKEFAMRGNVVDMAVGVVMGAAFGKIISALVERVINPPLGLLMGRVDFSRLTVVLQEKAADRPEVAIQYGAFLTAVIDFVFVAFGVFMMVKVINHVRRLQAEKTVPDVPPAPTPQERLLIEIRDLLKSQAR